MRQVRSRVVMHPETVERAESVIKDIKRSRRKAKEVGPTITRRYAKCPPWCNKAVWNTALRLADGNFRRLDVLSDTEIRVMNRER